MMDSFAWAWTLILGRAQSVFNAGSPYGLPALGGAQGRVLPAFEVGEFAAKLLIA